MSRNSHWFLFLFSLSTAPLGAAAGLSPMDYYNSLVAGGDDAGFRDGGFVEARFNRPSGLAFDEKGGRLFVADRGNHRIRAVYLNENHRVETVAGTGAPGKDDGPLSKATFNEPTAVCFLPGERLAVYEEGNHLLRLVNLKTKTVTTLGGNTDKSPALVIWSMVYRPQDGQLYYTEPAFHRIRRMDLKTGEVGTVLADDARLPTPKALCLGPDKLYAADQDLPLVCQVDPAAAPATVAGLVEVGKGNHIQALAWSDNRLYALQAGPEPLARILPDYQAVGLATPWGFLVDNQNPGTEPLLRFEGEGPVGFAASPTEDRKLFIAPPAHRVDSIISVKDYEFEKWWCSYSRYEDPTPLNYLTDFSYPPRKPAKTYRILVVGESRVLTAPVIDPGAKPGSFNELQWTITTNRILTFPKQLQLLLNLEASLAGSDTHFEVLTLGRHGLALSSYVAEEVPLFVKQYDVDLVLALAGKSGYEDFFQKPMTDKGVPAHDLDPEHLLKPRDSRIPKGVPGDFYERCIKKGLLSEGQGFPLWWKILMGADGEIRKDLLEMTARALRILSDELKAMKTSGGKAPQLLFFYVPWRDWYYNDPCESFWGDLCRENHFSMLDLGPSFTLLKTSFYPINQPNCMNHYTSSGNTLIAYLLKHFLIEKKVVPLQPSASAWGGK